MHNAIQKTQAATVVEGTGSWHITDIKKGASKISAEMSGELPV